MNVLSGGDSCATIGDEPERPNLSDWSHVGLPPKYYPNQTGASVSCGPITLVALIYEGDGLQPNFSTEDFQEGGVFRRTIPITAGLTPYYSFWRPNLPAMPDIPGDSGSRLPYQEFLPNHLVPI